MAPRINNLPENQTKPVTVHPDARRGRGAVSNTSGRFETETRVTRDEDFAFDDGWGGADTDNGAARHEPHHPGPQYLSRHAL